MFIWFAVHRGGIGGFLVALLSLVPYGGLTLLLWRARPRFEPFRKPLRARYGEWALITGASAGIGVEFARALARDGMSCVLTARRADRLEALAAELESAFAVKTRIVPLDLKRGRRRRAAGRGRRRSRHRVLVIANAGYGLAGRFDRQEPDRLRDMVPLNCVTPLVIINRRTRGMQAARPRRDHRRSARPRAINPSRCTPSTARPRPSTSSSARRCGPSCRAGDRRTGRSSRGPTITEFQTDGRRNPP